MAKPDSPFQRWMWEEGYTPRTIQSYSRVVDRCQEWLAERDYPPLHKAGVAHVREYAVEMIPETWASRNSLRSVLQVFCRFKGREGFPKGCVPVPRRPRMRSRALEPEDIAAVLGAAKKMGEQEFAAVALTFYAGLRRFEVCKMQWQDVDFDRDELRVLGKGYHEDYVPLHPEARAALLALPQTDEEGKPLRWVFPSDRVWKEHIADATLNLWFSAIRLATGIEVTPHVMRHSAITAANDRSEDLRTVQAFARHADPRQTADYSKINAEKLREVVEGLDVTEPTPWRRPAREQGDNMRAIGWIRGTEDERAMQRGLMDEWASRCGAEITYVHDDGPSGFVRTLARLPREASLLAFQGDHRSSLNVLSVAGDEVLVGTWEG